MTFNLVYFVVTSKWNQELRYSIRSFEKNFAELGDIWIIGDLPDYLDPRQVHHIPQQPMVRPGVFTQSGVRRLSMQQFPELGEQFVIASDDHYLLRPVAFEDFGPYILQELSEVKERGTSPWQLKLWRTYDLLVHMGYPTANYESHTPMRVDREKYLRMAALFINVEAAAQHDNQSYCPATAYWNVIGDQGRAPRQALPYRIGFTRYHRYRRKSKIISQLRDKTFLFHNDSGLTSALKSVIGDLYPDKSRFER